jgi:hypothetical protein
VRQHHVLDRLDRDFAHTLDHLPRQHRRRLRIDDDDAVVADDDAAVGVALGGKGIKLRPDLTERDLLVLEVAGGGEIGRHVGASSLSQAHLPVHR